MYPIESCCGTSASMHTTVWEMLLYSLPSVSVVIIIKQLLMQCASHDMTDEQVTLVVIARDCRKHFVSYR